MTKALSHRPVPDNRLVWAYRSVQLGLLAALVWKLHFFIAAVRVYRNIPVEHDFFPQLFRSSLALTIAYMVAVASILMGLVLPKKFFASRTWILTFSGLALASLSFLCLHQGSFNDMTFLTAWWTSLWSLWFAWRLGIDTPANLLAKGAQLSRMIISLVLLGGAAGKWTTEYWSGDVLFDIYFIDRDFWFFNKLKEIYPDPASLREFATLYSRMVIVTETVAGLTIWIMPTRTAAVVAIILLTSIAAFSNFLLFSVLMSLIGLATVGLFAARNSSKQ